MNFYNEFDPRAAAWIRELIARGLIPDGVVDERSITEIRPADLRGFTQCHFFAGISGWSLALQRAGWPSDRPVWTGSPPCQSFSAAGAQRGMDDDRHLWPVFRELIRACRPPVVFGEQVASSLVTGPSGKPRASGEVGASAETKAHPAWIDLVHFDVEAMDYAFGCVPFPSAGIGAPHIRDRLYWVADRLADSSSPRHPTAGERARIDGDGSSADAQRGQRIGEPPSSGDADRLANTDGSPGAQECAVGGGRPEGSDAQPFPGSGCDGVPCRVGDADDARPQGHAGHDGAEGRQGSSGSTPASGVSGGVADADGGDSCAEREQRGGEQRQQPEDGGAERLADANSIDSGQRGDAGGKEGLRIQCGAVSDGCGDTGAQRPGPINGLWRAADWLLCRDGKWRPVMPNSFPLANGIPARMVRLRGYGNAINVEAAKAFIESYLEG